MPCSRTGLVTVFLPSVLALPGRPPWRRRAEGTSGITHLDQPQDPPSASPNWRSALLPTPGRSRRLLSPLARFGKPPTCLPHKAPSAPSPPQSFLPSITAVSCGDQVQTGLRGMHKWALTSFLVTAQTISCAHACGTNPVCSPGSGGCVPGQLSLVKACRSLGGPGGQPYWDRNWPPRKPCH